ncbi:unnamed protein product, partial [Coregonus sp. 'balchen']
GDLSNQREREEGSVIRSNGSALKRDGYVSQSGFSPDPRDTPKHAIRLGEGPRWNPISPLANYATSHMTALASQHGHTRSQHAHTQPSHNQHGLNRPPSDPHAPQRGHTRSPHPLPQPQRGEDGQRRYVDASALYRPGGRRGSSGGGGAESEGGGGGGGEVSAMQSLIKYSGTFPPEGQGSSRQDTDNHAAFGGLGFMRLEEGGGGGRPMKREQERPDSTRSFGRGEVAGAGEGGGEVRHPPVGIAVAVARQRDSSGTDSRTQRPLLLHGGVKGKRGFGGSSWTGGHWGVYGGGEGKGDEERGGERGRHHGDRLGCLEREQEKLLRGWAGESPEEAPPWSARPKFGLTSGGGARLEPPLPPDAAQGAPPIGAGPPGDPVRKTNKHTPTVLGPSPLHQALPPYQLARDPQSGQLMVITTDHIPHYGGDVLDGGGAPVWPAVYGAGSSLQHAAQLQMLSQQQMLRQHELMIIQQHAAQVLELQRNAQLVERLKASEQRAALEDKTDKRSSEPKPRPSPRPTPSPSLHSHKTPLRSPPPSASSVTPLPSPRPALKHQEVRREGSHPSSPLPRTAAPRSASPLRPKQDADEGEEGGRERGEKQITAPFHRIYPDITPGYPYQSITAPFGAPFPPRPLTQPAGLNTHPPVSTLPRATAPDVKPRGPELRPDQGTSLKRDPDQEPPQLGMSPAALGPLLQTSGPLTLSHVERDGEPSLKHTHLTHTHTQLHTHPSLKHTHLTHTHTQLHTPHASLPSAPQPCAPLPPTHPQERQTEEEEEEEEEEEAGAVKTEVSTYGCRAAYQLPPSVPEKVEIKPEVTKKLSPARYPSCTTTASSERLTFRPSPDTHPHTSSPPPLSPSPPPPSPLNIVPEDPMAGMIALLAASQMTQAAPPVLLPSLLQTEASLGRDVASPGCLEAWAMEGMALLSHMASLEMDRIQLEQGEEMEEGRGGRREGWEEERGGGGEG